MVKKMANQSAKRDRLVESIILGIHPDMRALVAKCKGMQSVAFKMKRTLKSEFAFLSGLRRVAKNVFIDGCTPYKIVVFLLIVYGVVFWCESEQWFDFWSVIAHVEADIPVFDVAQVEQIIMNA